MNIQFEVFLANIYVLMTNSSGIISWIATDGSLSYQNSHRQRDESHPPRHWVTVVSTSLHSDTRAQIAALNKTSLISCVGSALFMQI